MKSKYTKQQIIKSIRYWQDILKSFDKDNEQTFLFENDILNFDIVNEAKTKALDFLEREFGHDRVFSSIPNEQFSQSLYKRIFRVLNATLFGNRLSPIVVALYTQDKFHDVLKKLGQDNDLTYYAAYIPQFSNDKSKVIRETMFMITDNGLLTFMFIVNSICHELIHQYDIHFGDMKNIIYNNKYIKGIEHKTRTFSQLMTLANMQGIKVMVTSKNTPIDILNQEAVQFTLNLQEDEENPNCIQYYIDRIKRGDTKGIENMAIAPDGSLCLILT